MSEHTAVGIRSVSPSGSVAFPLTFLSVVLAAMVACVAPAHAADQPDAALELAQRHRPVVLVRTQEAPCGEGEPYLPAPVESVLGRTDVVLRAADGSIIAAAPTATQLSAAGEDAYLDLPGKPLSPGCDYEQWWDGIAPGLPPTVYARVATDPERPGRLVVQYWFWWVYNDWNDKHEGDWEMVQVVFDADTPKQALEREPSQVVFAQHEGAQYVDWDSSQLRREGEHPVTFPSAGSHADYQSANRWFGKSAATGFGCDDTRAPLDRVDPAIVLLPSQVGDLTGPDDPFAWLAFQGRWGEKAPSFNNGPQGPALKQSWTNPIVWVEDLGRPSAVALPPLGTASTDLFCSASAAGSLLFIKFLDRPLLVGAAAVLVLALLVALIKRTRWRPSDPEPVQRPRGAGQLFLAAARLQRHRPRPYLGLAAVVLVGGIASTAIAQLVFGLSGLGEAADLAGDRSVYGVPLALLAGLLVTVPVVALVLTGAAVVVDREAEGGSTDGSGVLRQAVHPGGGFRAALVQVVLLASVGVLLAPLLIGLFLLSRWAPSTAVAVRDELPARSAFRRSSMLAKGCRWHVFGVGLTAVALMSVLGPLVGTLVLLVTPMPFAFVNLVAAVVSMAVVPWAGTVLALLREDLVARQGGLVG